MKKRIFTALLMSAVLFYYQSVCALPPKLSMTAGEVHTIKTVSAVSLSAGREAGVVETRTRTLWNETVSVCPTEDFSYRVAVFGIPCRTIAVNVRPLGSLVAMGRPVGVKLYASGLMTVGFSDIGDSCPALTAGMKAGDVIMELNGTPVDSTAHFKRLVQESGGKAVRLTVKRDEQPVEIVVIPAYEEGAYKLGAWVRDSIAGVGTLTFYDPDTLHFVSLGHGIADYDTGERIEAKEGSIVPCTILSVEKSVPGKAGELRGQFTGGAALGVIEENEDYGVTGQLLTAEGLEGKAVPVGMGTQIREGSASLCTTIHGEEPAEYEVSIERVLSLKGTRNMIIRVTDERLLKETGGIVQGMSGSPILQDGRLIGAVTHVFVDDPTRGYAISVENMMRPAAR